MISIHAPARGATGLRESRTKASGYFNSRPCERGDGDAYPRRAAAHPISIHAPARGATVSYQSLFKMTYISIHAPARGATRTPWNSFKPRTFQFTPLREGRPRKRPHGLSGACISIHAPARGATPFTQTKQNHGTVFQFTPLREGRPTLWRTTLSVLWYFNSRPCERGNRGCAR